MISKIKIVDKLSKPLNEFKTAIETMKITPGLNRRMHKLLTEVFGKDRMAEAKRDLIKEYTKGRVTSSTELLYGEAIGIIKHLEAYQKAGSVQKKPTSDAPNNKPGEQEIPTSEQLKKERANQMRRKIISMFREMGCEYYCTEKRRMVADMSKIYDYIKEVGYLKIHLNKYKYEELPKLVTQIESIYVKELTKKK